MPPLRTLANEDCPNCGINVWWNPESLVLTTYEFRTASGWGDSLRAAYVRCNCGWWGHTRGYREADLSEAECLQLVDKLADAVVVRL